MRHELSFYFQTPVVLLFKQIVRAIAFLWPRKRKLIAMGGWYGEMFNDSPKYLALHFLEHTDFTVVWIGKPHVRSMLPVHERMRFMEKGTLSAALSLLRAKTWVCCVSIEWDLTGWPLEGGATLINTGHGGGIKASGNSTGSIRRENKRASIGGRAMRFLEWHRRPWRLVGGDFDIDNLLVGDPACRYCRRDRMLKIGTPSNDFLINNVNADGKIRMLREKYSKMLGFDSSCKIVSYLPTWRNPGVEVRSFYGLSEDRQMLWREMLQENNAVLIEKHHYRTLEAFPVVRPSECSIPIAMDVQKQMDVQELLLITDVLISDYSGAYQDFAVMGRPCIHYAYDLEDYIHNCSGFVPGWEDMLAGPLIRTEGDLFSTVKRYLIEPKFEPAPGYAATREYQTGQSCEQICHLIINE